MEPPVSPAVYVPTTAMGFIMDATNDVAIYQSAATMAHTDGYKLPNVRTTLPTWPKTNPRAMIKTMIGKCLLRVGPISIYIFRVDFLKSARPNICP